MRVAVIGAGSWGTALALVAARDGRDVSLWARDAPWLTRGSTIWRRKSRLTGLSSSAQKTQTSDSGDMRSER